MKNKKLDIKRPVVLPLIALLLLVLWLGYVRGDIGMSERAMCRDNADYMEDGDVVTCHIGDTMASFLQYNVEDDDYDLDIYVKRKNRIGWFFRFSGASGALDYLQQMNCEGNEEYVLCYLSPGPAVSRIQVDKGDGTTMTITPEENKPFACVLSHRWYVVAYDDKGNVIQPVERSL